MVVPQLKAFVFSALLLQTFIFPDLIRAQRNGETGRYVYTDDTDQIRYCHYCDEKDLNINTQVKMAQVNQCIKNNFPFTNKTDEEEQRRKLRPLCNRGKLPSCPLLHRILNGEWNCGHSPHLMDSEFYNSAVDGYILPVYTSCSLVCVEGYHVVGTDSLYCNESRQWDTETRMINCTKDPVCPLLNRTLNRKWECSFSRDQEESKFYKQTFDGYIVPVGTICSLVCSEGYHVIGTNIIHCNKSHQWNTETGAIYCAKNPDRNDDIEEHHLPVIIGSVTSVCAVIGIVGIIFICYYVCKGTTYKTEEDSSVESDTSSSSLIYFKRAVEHEEIKYSEDLVNETNSLLKPMRVVNKKEGDLGKGRKSDKKEDKKEGSQRIGKNTSHLKSNQINPDEEVKYLIKIKIPVEHNDLSGEHGVHVESKESYSMQEQINKGLQEDQTEIELRASCDGDKDDKTMNHVEGGRDLVTNPCQVLSKRRERGDGIEAGDCSHEHKDDPLLKTNSHKHKDDPLLSSKDLKKGIRNTEEIIDTNFYQLCGKGKKFDPVVKVDMNVDASGLDNPKVTHPQTMLEFKDEDTNGCQIQLLRKKHEKETTGGRKETPVIAEGGSDAKVMVAYLSEEQGRERVMVREYEVNKFSVPYGKRFFIVPKCQGTINRLNVSKDEGCYRGSQYASYQFLHVVESARADDHGSYNWKIFLEECGSPKYMGRLFIKIEIDQLSIVSLLPLDSNLLSSPFWQSMNPESVLDDSSLSVRDRPSGRSCSPIINQAGSGALTGLHQQETGSAMSPGAVEAAQNLDAAEVSRRQCSSDPCHCTETVESAWNDNSLKMDELIHRGENEFMPWTHLGSRVLDMKPWFLECLEWHLRGRVHDGPMKYILKQMVHDGKKIGHLVEHFAFVCRYDLVNCIKTFHSCDYCKCFYNRYSDK
ncbi:hypothetical protein CHS0354_033479 [Potamilus streckersoni]|uniref:Sushi domain-containing protein n=1 Tax=Potamilus streckersoni TaxID=2493646 RepID=A0AAE0VJI9_9BIVA|nr:hypothetical protein CHS0354_033479 [Potamilus streckersoni]